jgi:hypothetical protein
MRIETMGKREREELLPCWERAARLHQRRTRGGAQKMAAGRGRRSSRSGGGAPVRLRGESSSLSLNQ